MESLSAPAASTTLKPKQSPRQKIATVFIAALIWNGIVCIFLVDIINSFRIGHPNWISILFISPFVLIGMLLIFGFFYNLLASVNPIPVLTLEPAKLVFGQTARLSWQLTGKVSRIQKLTVKLLGKQILRIKKENGKTRREVNIFHKTDILETSDSTGIPSGRVEFEVPLTPIPAEGDICWELSIEGDIRFWPNVREKFSLQIEPANNPAGST